MEPNTLKRRWKRWKGRNRVKKYRQGLDSEAEKYLTPMPPLRRKLTASSIIDRNLTCPRFDSQVKSAFFNVLPLDIRKLIYDYVVGDKVLHIVRKGKRLAYLRCQAQAPGSHYEDRCWGHQNYDATFDYRHDLGDEPGVKLPWNREDWKAHYSTDGGLLPLLLSCRRIYSEAIYDLYHHSQFCFSDERTWALFRSVIPSHRLNLVRSLHMQLMWPNFTCIFVHPARGSIFVNHRPARPVPEGFFSDEDDWIELWDSIRDLEGLRLLEVRVEAMPQFCFHRFRRWSFGTWQTLSTASERDEEFRDILLDPLRNIKGLEKFTIELPVFHGVRDGDPFIVTCPEWIEGGQY